MSSSRSIGGTAIVIALAVAQIDPAGAMTAEVARRKHFLSVTQGVESYKKGDAEAAIAALQEATSIALNSFLAHYYLGLSLFAARRYDEAVEPLRIALDLEPTHLQAHVALGDCYLKLGDVQEARAEYTRALAVRGDWAPAHDGLGRMYALTGDDDAAIESFETALRIDASFAEGYINLGDFYLERGELERAKKLYLELSELRPDYAAAYTRLGFALGRQKLFNEAISVIQKAYELDPRSAVHPYALGVLYRQMGAARRASGSLMAAMKLDPDMGATYGELATIHRSQGRYAEALQTLTTGLERPYMESRERKLLESQKADLEREVAAIELLEGSIAERPEVATSYFELGDLYAKAENFAAAVELYEQALERAPTADSARRLELAYFLLRAEQPRRAIDLYGSLPLDGEPDALINLGVALNEVGQFEEALDVFRRALVAEPDLELAHLYAGNAHMRLGQREEAAAEYRLYLDRAPEDATERPRVARLLEVLP